MRMGKPKKEAGHYNAMGHSSGRLTSQASSRQSNKVIHYN